MAGFHIRTGEGGGGRGNGGGDSWTNFAAAHDIVRGYMINCNAGYSPRETRSTVHLFLSWQPKCSSTSARIEIPRRNAGRQPAVVANYWLDAPPKIRRPRVTRNSVHVMRITKTIAVTRVSSGGIAFLRLPCFFCGRHTVRMKLGRRFNREEQALSLSLSLPLPLSLSLSLSLSLFRLR